MSCDPPSDGIPLSVPWLVGNEAAYLEECVRTNWVSSAGSFVERFEREIAAHLEVGHAIAAVNGTAALHVALLVAGVRPDDAVLTSTLTFIAPGNAVRYVGAWPVFVDADPATWQMDAGLAVDFLGNRCERRDDGLHDRDTGRRIGAVLPVHVLGHPVDMDPIVEAARDLGVAVVEDATESLGAAYKGRPVGALADIACLSFNGNKLVTCGGGGMIVTNREDWARQARHLTTQARTHPHEYVHDEIGFNYRLTNIQAALGCAQLENLEARIAAKRRIAAAYAEMCAEQPGLSFMPAAQWADAMFWLSTILVDADVFGADRYDLLRFLADKGIESRPLWQPLHRSPAHRGAQALGGDAAERLYGRALSLPSSCGLTPGDQERVIAAIIAAVA